MYRVVISGAEATDRELLRLGCAVEYSADGETWSALEGAPTSMALSLSAVRDVLRGDLDDVEKRVALLEMVRTTARALPAFRGLVAVEELEELLPAGWPVTVTL